MSRKIARQSEVTPLGTIDHYLWNERLGVTQLPPVDTSQGQANTSSLPPQSSQAPTIDYDSSASPSDMFGSGVSGEDQLIAPQVPRQEPSSVPAVSKKATITTLKAAVSTLYGDVSPTPTTGEGGGGDNGSQSNRNNSSEDLPNGPDSSPASGLAEGEEGGAGLASELGEAGSLALLASKRFIGSVLDPKESKKDEEGHYKYIKHRNGKWVIVQKGTGKVLSTHDSREKAIESFKAMMMSKHGG